MVDWCSFRLLLLFWFRAVSGPNRERINWIWSQTIRPNEDVPWKPSLFLLVPKQVSFMFFFWVESIHLFSALQPWRCHGIGQRSLAHTEVQHFFVRWKSQDFSKVNIHRVSGAYAVRNSYCHVVTCWLLRWYLFSDSFWSWFGSWYPRATSAAGSLLKFRLSASEH